MEKEFEMDLATYNGMLAIVTKYGILIDGILQTASLAYDKERLAFDDYAIRALLAALEPSKCLCRLMELQIRDEKKNDNKEGES